MPPTVAAGEQKRFLEQQLAEVQRELGIERERRKEAEERFKAHV
jgi:hypothetical protein